MRSNDKPLISKRYKFIALAFGFLMGALGIQLANMGLNAMGPTQAFASYLDRH